MPALTADQTLSLALSFRTDAQTISDFLHDHWGELSPDDRAQVHDNVFDMLLRADDVNALAGILVLDSAQSSVDQINAAVGSANQFLKDVADVKKAVGIVTAILGLASAIAAKNPSDIVNGLKALQSGLA
jgi:hypothetical protein